MPDMNGSRKILNIKTKEIFDINEYFSKYLDFMEMFQISKMDNINFEIDNYTKGKFDNSTKVKYDFKSIKNLKNAKSQVINKKIK